MSQSIFTSQTPASPNNIDGDDSYTLGTVFTASVNGTISGIRWFYPTTLPSVAVIGLLYSWTTDTTGTELVRATFSSPVAGAWNTVSFGVPQAITAGMKYVAAIWTRDRYVSTGGLFSSAITNGNLTAVANDNVTPVHNGKFHVVTGTSSPTFPESTFGANGYFVDVLFDPSGGAVVNATAVAATAGVPTPTVQTGETVTATAVAAVAGVPAPTIRTGETVAAVAVAAVAGVPTPTIQTGETVSAVAVAAVAGVPAPTIRTGSSVAVGAVAAFAGVPTPTVVTSGNVTVFATAVAAFAGIPTPLVNPGTGGTGPVLRVGAPLRRWLVGAPKTRWKVD